MKRLLRVHGEAVGGYVLAALEPGEMAEMRLHIESCPRCATRGARA